MKNILAKLKFKPVTAAVGKVSQISKASYCKFKGFKRSKKIMCYSALGVVVVSGITWISLSGHSSSTQNYVLTDSGVKPAVDPVALKMSEIQAQIASLQKTEEHSHQLVSRSAITALNQNVLELKQAVSDLQTTSPQNMSDLKAVVASNTQNLSSQLSDLKNTVNDLKQQATPKVYLPVSTLPWAVAGIDVRNYVPVVVRADGFGAIAKGDVRDGWKLIDVQFEPPLAIFQNVAIPSQYVKVGQ